VRTRQSASMSSGGQLILKRASASRASGEWSDDDYDVLANGVAVGRIMKAVAAPVGPPWLWTYGFNPRECRPAHGYAATRERSLPILLDCRDLALISVS